MSEYDYEPPTLSPTIPSVVPRDRIILYDPDGREITIRRPIGFVNHPEVRKREAER